MTKCKSCGEMKQRNKDALWHGQFTYRDEQGLKWHGLICNSCHKSSERSRKKQSYVAITYTETERFGSSETIFKETRKKCATCDAATTNYYRCTNCWSKESKVSTYMDNYGMTF